MTGEPGAVLDPVERDRVRFIILVLALLCGPTVCLLSKKWRGWRSNGATLVSIES